MGLQTKLTKLILFETFVGNKVTVQREVVGARPRVSLAFKVECKAKKLREKAYNPTRSDLNYNHNLKYTARPKAPNKTVSHLSASAKNEAPIKLTNCLK